MAREAEHSLTRVRGRTRCQHCPGHHIQLCPAVPEGAAHAGLSRDGRELLQGFFLVCFPREELPWLWPCLVAVACPVAVEQAAKLV